MKMSSQPAFPRVARTILAAVLQISVFANFADDLRAQENPPEVSICFYDLGNYGSGEDSTASATLEKLLSETSPDILVLCGVRDRKALSRAKQLLGGAKFAEIVEAEDKERRIGIISRIKPEDTRILKDMKYKIEESELPVQRGFLHCIFNVEGYRFHLLAADLKNRDKDEDFNQTDMRRYEARLLRYYVTDIIKQDSESNILIAANLNDTCGMSPVKEIYNRRFDIVKRLYDIRPLDSLKTSWTFWNPASDEYERIDYFITTSSLIPEISRAKTRIFDSSGIEAVSGHRPILTSIVCRDLPRWSKEKLQASYPNTIYEGAAGHFEEDKPIGDKPPRNPPSKNP